MWNGSLDWQNLSDQCTELTCHHLQSILSLLGLFICSGCVGKVSNKVTRFKKICFTVGIGKKSKVDDYSRLQDAQSAKSAGMFKKSKRSIYCLIKPWLIFCSWKWVNSSWFSQYHSWVLCKFQGSNKDWICFRLAISCEEILQCY